MSRNARFKSRLMRRRASCVVGFYYICADVRSSPLDLISLLTALDEDVSSDTLLRFPIDDDFITFSGILTDYSDKTGAPRVDILLEKFLS